MHREALDIRRNAFGSQSLEVAESLAGLAAVLIEKADYVQAENLLQESLRLPEVRGGTTCEPCPCADRLG